MSTLSLNNNKKGTIATVLFVLYILTILTLLVIPTSNTINLSKYFLGFRTDHFIHTCLFFPFMGYIWIRNLHKGTLYGFFIFFLIGILFAAFCESLHFFIKYRSLDIHDFFANVTGLTLGNIAFLFKSPKY